ncbi:ATP-grasp domain-containing protein [Cupriavidus necator]|uniref:ATP-grasp domain-containing protein n=1 Tax=Cupriavidus necator TaxID=106590 RepID=UPI00339D4D2A
MTRVFVYEYISGGGVERHVTPELLAQGRLMRDAMIGDLARIDDVTVSCAVSPAEWREDCYGALNVAYCRRRTGETPLAFVRRQAARHDVSWVVAPESGGTLLRLRRAVDSAGWLGSSATAIALAGSKAATVRHLRGLGIATTRPWRDGDVPQPDCGRWVVKPDDGAGAVATRSYSRFDAAHAAWRQRLAAGETVVLEPWVEGVPLSVSMLCGPGGAEVLSINRQRIRVDGDGVVHYDGVQTNIMDPAGPQGRVLARLAEAVAGGVPGLSGFVGIDVVLHPRQGPVVIEINPRVTCAYRGLSAALGRNLALEMLASHQVCAEMQETNGASNGG